MTHAEGGGRRRGKRRGEVCAWCVSGGRRARRWRRLECICAGQVSTPGFQAWVMVYKCSAKCRMQLRCSFLLLLLLALSSIVSCESSFTKPSSFLARPRQSAASLTTLGSTKHPHKNTHHQHTPRGNTQELPLNSQVKHMAVQGGEPGLSREQGEQGSVGRQQTDKEKKGGVTTHTFTTNMWDRTREDAREEGDGG